MWTQGKDRIKTVKAPLFRLKTSPDGLHGFMKGFKVLAAGIIIGGLLSGCSHVRFPAAFKIDVAQGNILEKEKVEQLRPGMNQRQVVYLLGSPVMRDAFDEDEWNYVYEFSKSGGVPHRYRLTLKFEGKVLKSIEGDLDKIKDWHEEKNA